MKTSLQETINRAQEIAEQVKRLKKEIQQLNEDTRELPLPKKDNLSKDLETATRFLERAKIDLERGCKKMNENLDLLNQWKAENWTFTKAVQVELLFDKEEKIKEISPLGFSFMIEEGIDPIGKTMNEIKWSGGSRTIGWYGPIEVAKYRGIGEEETVITAAELKYIMPSLELE